MPFSPATNLAQLTANLADAFDAMEDLHTGAIAQDQLAGMSFSQRVSGAYLETTGCLSFYVDGTSSPVSFKVFVAELPPDADVEALAAGAERDDQAVSFDNSRLILFLAPPNFDEGEDDAFDFGDYLATAQRALTSSTRSVGTSDSEGVACALMDTARVCLVPESPFSERSILLVLRRAENYRDDAEPSSCWMNAGVMTVTSSARDRIVVVRDRGTQTHGRVTRFPVALGCGDRDRSTRSGRAGVREGQRVRSRYRSGRRRRGVDTRERRRERLEYRFQRPGSL